MGKLGSHELTAGSDVDLILLYDHDDAAGDSDGAKPIDALRYFTRITQRLIAALSAPTAEGVLYAVDMRLRPSGNKGPVATRLGAFAKYQREEAWTWEHMALTRARVIAGDAGLAAETRATVATLLSADRDPATLSGDVAEMRALIETEKPPRDLWDLKLIAGGLVDIEFIAQFLALSAGSASIWEEGTPSTAEVIARLGPRQMTQDDTDRVLETLQLFTEISQIIRLCIDGPFDPKEAPAGLIDLVCRAADAPDLRATEADIRRLSTATRTIFRALVGEKKAGRAKGA